MKIALCLGLPLLLLVGGCAGMPVVSRNQATPSPTAEEMRELTAGRVTPVVVQTSPFPDVTPYRLGALVATEMPRLNQAIFASATGVQIPSRWVVEWQFGGVRRGDRTDVTASLALRSPGLPPVSEVHGHVESVSGVEDPAFHRFVEQMTLGLLWPDRDLGGSGSPFDFFFFAF